MNLYCLFFMIHLKLASDEKIYVYLLKIIQNYVLMEIKNFYELKLLKDNKIDLNHMII